MAKTDLYNIYALKVSGRIFYVGQTMYALNDRLLMHIRHSKTQNTPAAKAVKYYVDNQRDISIILIESCSNKIDADNLEVYHIRRLAKLYPLVNKNLTQPRKYPNNHRTKRHNELHLKNVQSTGNLLPCTYSFYGSTYYKGYDSKKMMVERSFNLGLTFYFSDNFPKKLR